MATKKKAAIRRKAGKAATRPSSKRKAAPRRAAPPRPGHKKRTSPESLRLRMAMPGFTVNDIEKSLVFYRDVLRFTPGERWEQEGKLAGVELMAGAVRFMIGQDDWKKGRDRSKGEGFRIYCTTAQDVDVLAAGIRARGGQLLQEPMDQPWGTRDFAVADPDGFKITISSEERR